MIKVNMSLHTIPDDLNNDNNSLDGELARVISHVENQKLKVKDFSFSMYKIKSVKEKLQTTFFGKCAYCESDFENGAYGHIEHWRPKGKVTENPDHLGYYWLASNWNNLLYSCQVCNIGYKKNYFPLENPNEYSLNSTDTLENEKPLLVNPYFDNPDEHFVYKLNGDVEGMTNKGITSIEKYGLSRKELVIKRNTSTLNLLRIIKSIIFLIDLASGLHKKYESIDKIAIQIEECFEEVNSLIKPESEFSKMHKDILKDQVTKYEKNKVFLSLIDEKIKF